MPVITEAAIKDLAGFRSDDAPVVSCYLDVDGRRQVRPQDIERRAGGTGAARRRTAPRAARSAADLDRITEHVAKQPRPLRRPRPGHLLVRRRRASGRSSSLPVPVANRIVVNQSPAVGTLESIVQELEPLGVLLVDRQRARMFVFQFGELVERTELFEALPRDYDQIDDAGRGRHDRLQDHTDELATQHLRHAAEVAFRLYQDNGFGRLTHRRLRRDQRRHRAAAAPLPARAPRRRASRSAPARRARGARRPPWWSSRRSSGPRRPPSSPGSATRVGAGAQGRGRARRHPRRRSNERRAATLARVRGLHRVGLALRRAAPSPPRARTCPVDGQAMEHVDDVVEDAVDVALAQGCHVEVCVGNADLDVLGRIGALLRY